MMHILKVKTQNRQIGDLGESLAEKYLKSRGYKIIKKNYVYENTEIDIIASTADTVAFVEVKTRSFKENEDITPSRAVTREKQRKIIKAARHYAAFYAKDKILRLDVIEVTVDGKKQKEINHIKNAFNDTRG